MLGPCNEKGISISYWFTIVLLLCAILKLNAQNGLLKELEQAQTSIYHKNPQKSVGLSLSIYNRATDLDTKITALITLVNGYTAMNENEKSMTYAVQAKDIAKESRDIHLQVRTLGLLGEQYQLFHLNSISREYLKKAEKLINTATLTAEMTAVSQGNIYAVIGNSYKDQIDCRYAIANYDKAIAAYKLAPKNSSAQNNLALVYLEKGNCLIETGDLKNAEINYIKAKSIASSNDLLEYLNYVALGLAKIESKNKEYISSIERLSALSKDTLSFAQSNIQTKTYALLRENYKQINNTEAYLSVQKKYVKSLNQINEIENSNSQQILSFIQNTTFEKENNFSPIKILVYILTGIGIFIGIYEIKRSLSTVKLTDKKD